MKRLSKVSAFTYGKGENISRITIYTPYHQIHNPHKNLEMQPTNCGTLDERDKIKIFRSIKVIIS